MKKIVLILTSILAAALLLGACALVPAAATPTPEVTATPEAATSAEATDAGDSADGLSFTLTTLTGDTVDQTVFTDHKLIMVNYWATWCGPCVGEIPDLQKLSEDYADKGFALVGVLTGGRRHLRRAAVHLRRGADLSDRLSRKLLSRAWKRYLRHSTTMFFDSEGKQVGQTIVGAKSYDDWAGLIELLLGQVG